MIEIAGPDAIAFAHAQFSSDVRALETGSWQWSAWLSAQGRVRTFFRLLRPADARLIMLLNGGSAEAVRSGLAPYVFRSNVQVRVVEGCAATGFFDRGDALAALHAEPPGGARIVTAPNFTGIAVAGAEARWYVFGGATHAADQSAEALNHWRAADIAAGIVELSDVQIDKFLPQWLGLDTLGAISLQKGCYPGQEVVARLHYKGGNKRWLYRIEFLADRLPTPGTVLGDGESAAGELLSSAWTDARRGLALAILSELAPETILKSPSMPATTFRVVSAIRCANA
jgi:tRNA-modifying protein YgfZ